MRVRTIEDVDVSLYLVSKIFRENCDEVVKLVVLNEQLLKDITYLLKEKYNGVREVNLYGNTLRINTTYDGKLSTKDIVDIEELCGMTLDKVEDGYYWFELDINGNYNSYFNHGKHITDFSEDYRRIHEMLYGEV